MSGIENFSGFEVIRAAMEVEKQGRRFYSALSTRAQGELTREIFAMLAQDESAHLRMLETMLEQYQDGAFWENEELFLPYLNRFSAEQVFPAEAALEKVLSLPDVDCRVLDLAIDAERKFAEYFRLAAEHSHSDDGRKAFAWLADEELRHAEILATRRTKLFGHRAGEHPA